MYALSRCQHPVSERLLQILDRVAAKTSVDCLDLFRHFMVDIISATLFGCRPGSMDKWALNVHDPLTTAVNDFPKRGIIVSRFMILYLFILFYLNFVNSGAPFQLGLGTLSVVFQIVV